MDFRFDPTFALLAKFGIGLWSMPTTADEVRRVARYLGIDLPSDDVQENARRLTDALERQNGFLAKNLESDSICESKDYRRSKFIKDIVANSRQSKEQSNAPPR